ncbi:DNA-directed RNA polymerase subunit epsilon [Halorubrum californiense]|nr:DNA-directed RNA polymerase subunit epsilon [Halorubrum californiense]
MSERTSEDVDGDKDESEETDQYLAEETPEQQSSRQQELDHSSEKYTTGYDAFGETRVGIGSAGGDVTKLIRHNEGRHRSDGNHSVREAARDKGRVTESFCSTLDLPSHQQRTAVAAMATMNLDRFGRQKRLEKVALATIKVVVEWDRSRRFPDDSLSDLDEDDLPTRMLDDPDYREILDQHDVSKADLYSVSQLVKRELKKEAFFTPGGRSKSDATTGTGIDVDNG